MSEHTHESTRGTLEMRSRELLDESVAGLDMRVRSRLARARRAALDESVVANRRPWAAQQLRLWAPAAGMTAAVLVGATLWFGAYTGSHGTASDGQSPFEVLDIVAATDEGSADAMEMLQNDLDFYDFADKSTGPGPAA